GERGNALVLPSLRDGIVGITLIAEDCLTRKMPAWAVPAAFNSRSWSTWILPCDRALVCGTGTVTCKRRFACGAGRGPYDDSLHISESRLIGKAGAASASMRSAKLYCVTSARIAGS